MEPERRQYSLLILMMLAFLIRGGVLFFNLGSFSEDPDGYKALARTLRTDGVYGQGETPTAFRPPLYPALLWADSYLARDLSRPESFDPNASSRFSLRLTENAAIALLHWILGLATVLLVYQIGRALGWRFRGSALAALLVACDPILLQQSRLVMTETLAAFFAALSVLLLIGAMMVPRGNRQRLAFFGVGVTVGLAALCRPTFLVFLGLCFCVMVVYELKGRIAWFTPAAFLAGAALLVLPWGWRNLTQLDHFTVTTTHGGYTLLLANNDFLYDAQQGIAPLKGPWDAEPFHKDWQNRVQTAFTEASIVPGTVEAELLEDRLANETARACIKQCPKDFALATLWRIGHFWQPLPYQVEEGESTATRAARYGIGVFYTLELLLAFCGLILLLRSRFRSGDPIFAPGHGRWVWPTLLILSVQLPHLVYWTNMRMRAPASALIPLFATLLIVAVVRRFRQTKGAEAPLKGRF